MNTSTGTTPSLFAITDEEVSTSVDTPRPGHQAWRRLITLADGEPERGCVKAINAGYAEPEYWFAAPERRHVPAVRDEPEEASLARAICGGCTVREACLDYALWNEHYGIFGGLDGDQRDRLRAQRHGKKYLRLGTAPTRGPEAPVVRVVTTDALFEDAA